MEAYLLILCNLHLDVSDVLALQQPHHVRRQRLVSTIGDRHTALRLALDHAPVELILVAEGGLLAELLNPVLL